MTLFITNIAEGSTPINKLKCCCEFQIFLICCRSWWIVQKVTFRNDYIFFNLSFESCPGLFLRNTPQIYEENIFPGSSSIFVSFVGRDRKVQAGKILENIKGKTWTNLQLVVNPHPLMRILNPLGHRITKSWKYHQLTWLCSRPGHFWRSPRLLLGWGSQACWT